MTTRKRILVVEDNPKFARQYKRSLERAGFECDIVETRQDAITLLQNKSFDAAIVDLQLRDDITHKGGIDVLEYIAKCDEDIRAFAVSASEEIRDSVKSYKVGAVEFVVKADMESTDEMVPRLLNATAGLRKLMFGPYDSLRAYLAAPEATIYWDSSVQNVLGCTYQALQEGFARGLDRYVPILRRIDGSPSFAMNNAQQAMMGTFWSKQLGMPIWVCAYGSKGSAIGPPDLTARPDKEAHIAGFNIAVWHLSSPARSAFTEFVRGSPWKK